MSFSETTLLGALAGFTIYLGLPFGRLRLLGDRARVGLAMFSVGVLAFIFVDVMEHASGSSRAPSWLQGRLRAASGTRSSSPPCSAVGFAVGSAGLATVERRLGSMTPLPPISGGAVDVLTAEQVVQRDSLARSRALRIGVTIALAIGLHNFAEGLAIGVSASAGNIGLATVLIVGFALHNATEGFGIVGPLGDVRPSWRWLGMVGLIGGAPTFLGAMLGYSVTSEPLELVFYARRRRRDPLRDRRDLERHASLRPSRARVSGCSRSASSSGSRPTSSSPTAAAEPAHVNSSGRAASRSHLAFIFSGIVGGMNVLVVEDEVKMAALIRRGLSEQGLTVDVAGTGEEAVGDGARLRATTRSSST